MRLFLLSFLLVALAVLTGCGDTETGNDGSSVSLQFPTASTTGTIYPLGSAMANLWQEELGYKVSAQASNGGVHNLNLLKDGEADISFATVGIIWEAYHGERSFEGRPYEDVRIIAGLYYNPNQFVVREGAGIETIADLKGKRFAPGASGSTPEVESSIILTEYGLNYPDDIQANFVGFTEAIDLMRNNQIDGALIQAGLPTAAVTEMTSTAGGKLIGIDPEIRASLMKKYPWYSEFVIPAGTYDNQDEDVETLAIKMMLIADASVEEEVVYNLVKTMWENLDKLKSAHPIVEQFDINQATTDLAGIPLHPGAEKYYKEIGVLTE
ncbi:TAXI family TRAP transporter solute-binding subunit [Caldalkalibacillus thermarum TA2.A1]|uniref:TAXI family TRAP transporter solute-binding subunit n=2 Tax=Caldalkalibacillus thermarum (strain TA2.A1) TaxID=986075 RepID=A0A8X8LBP2_CALTT|nr:TAXI family TRAP transporter solute-binding subunit [Caldalkalibacillus thermarum]QZT35163.1 TAXI family TRAP transporter solute-binding subunit [Caldalkalibacillus thermarum TA2.A1]